MLARQIRFEQDGRHTTGWVKLDRRLKKGVKVTLDGLDGWWTVAQVYGTPRDMSSIRQDWKVGGLEGGRR